MQKKLIPILIVVLLAIGGLFYYNRYMSVPTVDLTKLILTDHDGQPFSITSLKGKKNIIFMYGSWCGSCVKELKEVNKIKDEQLGDMNIVCITDESLEELREFEQKKGYPFTFLKLEQTFNDIGIFSIPVTYFVNGNLEIVEENLGYIPWDDLSTVNHLKSVLGE